MIEVTIDTAQVGVRMDVAPEKSGTVGVTGATGLVGKTVCRELEQRGWKVVPLVRSSANLVNERIVGDLADLSPNADVLHDLDVIVHAAARVHVMHDSAIHPLEEYRRINTDGTMRLARAADIAGVRRFVFISSVKVNGESTTLGRPYQATDVPAPIDAYGVSKLEAEQGLAELAAQSDLEVVVIRPVLVYGPGVKANFAALISLVRRGIPLPFGRIFNRRSLIFVRNLADLIAVCLVHPAASGRTFLAADAESVSTPALVTALAQAHGRRARLVPFSVKALASVAWLFRQQAAIQRLTDDLEVDIDYTRRVLNWTPPFTLTEGLAATVTLDGKACT